MLSVAIFLCSCVIARIAPDVADGLNLRNCWKVFRDPTQSVGSDLHEHSLHTCMHIELAHAQRTFHSGCTKEKVIPTPQMWICTPHLHITLTPDAHTCTRM
uniref:Secreted protein n=1 Tax=Lotharella globosa TaxID=91324 RepID=A0A7S4DQF9_9EUKA